MRLLTRRGGLGWDDTASQRDGCTESFDMGLVISVSVLNRPNPPAQEGTDLLWRRRRRKRLICKEQNIL